MGVASLHNNQVDYDTRRYKQLAQQKQSSTDGTDDGGSTKDLTPEELAKMAEEEPFRALADMMAKDRKDESETGVRRKRHGDRTPITRNRGSFRNQRRTPRRKPPVR